MKLLPSNAMTAVGVMVRVVIMDHVIFQARSLEQKRKWCREIKRLILENFQSVIPEKVKELVMELGKSREEEGECGDGVWDMASVSA